MYEEITRFDDVLGNRPQEEIIYEGEKVKDLQGKEYLRIRIVRQNELTTTVIRYDPLTKTATGEKRFNETGKIIRFEKRRNVGIEARVKVINEIDLILDATKICKIPIAWLR